STHSPCAAFRPVLRAAARPPFGRWSAWNPGISAAKASHMAPLASVEPSSTSRHSQSFGPCCSATLLTQAARYCCTLYTGTMMENSGMRGLLPGLFRFDPPPVRLVQGGLLGVGVPAAGGPDHAVRRRGQVLGPPA